MKRKLESRDFFLNDDNNDDDDDDDDLTSIQYLFHNPCFLLRFYTECSLLQLKMNPHNGKKVLFYMMKFEFFKEISPMIVGKCLLVYVYI